MVWAALTDPAQLVEWAPFDADRRLAATGPVKLSTVGTPAPHWHNIDRGFISMGPRAGTSASTCSTASWAASRSGGSWVEKEWAYAGFAIDLASALVAHFAVGDGPQAWGWAAATGVLWGLSYIFWRRTGAKNHRLM
jgi:hypothetical protein